MPKRSARRAIDRHLVAVADALRVGFVLLGAVAIATSGIVDLGTVVVAAVASLVPRAVEPLAGRLVWGPVHLAFVLLPLVEATGRVLELYEGHPVPFDVAAHFLEVGAATAVVLLAVSWLAPRLQFGRALVRTVGAGLACGAVIAVGWEVVEATFDPVFAGTFQHGFADTSTDVAAGVAGAVAAGGLVVLYSREALAGRRNGGGHA